MVLSFNDCGAYGASGPDASKYPVWARAAARRFTDVTGYECRIIGRDECGRQPRDFNDMLRVRMEWPRWIPDADVVISLDADTVWMRPWDPLPLCADGSIVTSRTHRWWDNNLAAWYSSKGLPGTYVVDGYWAAPRAAADLFLEVAERWPNLNCAHDDVGSLSQVICERCYPVRWIDLRFQWRAWGTLAPRIGVTSLHVGSLAYEWWDTNNAPAPVFTPPDLEWDPEMMSRVARSWPEVGLYPDGSSVDGRGWFWAQDRFWWFSPADDVLCP